MHTSDLQVILNRSLERRLVQYLGKVPGCHLYVGVQAIQRLAVTFTSGYPARLLYTPTRVLGQVIFPLKPVLYQLLATKGDKKSCNRVVHVSGPFIFNFASNIPEGGQGELFEIASWDLKVQNLTIGRLPSNNVAPNGSVSPGSQTV